MRALDGYLVLDLTHVYAGPFAAQQMAALGARVIKIEPPFNPDMTRDDTPDDALADAGYATGYQAHGAGKESLALDLRGAQGKHLFDRLLARADVLLTNYTRGALDRLGLDPASCAAVKPDLIWCGISGFGRTGPKADHPAYDVVIQAHTGLMSLNGHEQGSPVRIGPAVVDYGTGAQAALAVVSALLRRERTGQGQVLDVAMADAAMMLMSSDVAETESTGRSPGLRGNINTARAAYGVFRARDRDLMIGAYTGAQTVALLKALGLTDDAAQMEGAGRKVLRASANVLRNKVAGVIATRDAADWEDRLNGAHVPAAVVRSLEEGMAQPQYDHRGVRVSLPPTVAGGIDRHLVAGFMAEADGPDINKPPPTMGQDTRAIMAELGLDKAEIDALYTSRVIA